MDDVTQKDGVWFVYDGECPLCHSAAHAFRIKQAYGTLHLIDARTSQDNPLVLEITRRGIDLDEGVVIYDGDRYYHGKDALNFMARFGDGSANFFTAVCRALFRGDTAAALSYPWMRGTRNLLLCLKGVGRIKNLN